VVAECIRDPNRVSATIHKANVKAQAVGREVPHVPKRDRRLALARRSADNYDLVGPELLVDFIQATRPNRVRVSEDVLPGRLCTQPVGCAQCVAFRLRQLPVVQGADRDMPLRRMIAQG